MTMLRGIAAAVLAAMLGGTMALAWAAEPAAATRPLPPDEVEVAAKLLRQGDLAGAEQRIDAALQRAPKDARARFLKGLLLTARGDANAAIAVFTALTDDYPELPEPYNNLAVLHAAQGRYDRARDALEAAVRARPDFPTAHENLGDIYTRMAAQSYEQASKLDRTNESARVKLRMANELLAYRPAPAAGKPSR